jgi:hypothetical protein
MSTVLVLVLVLPQVSVTGGMVPFAKCEWPVLRCSMAKAASTDRTVLAPFRLSPPV